MAEGIIEDFCQVPRSFFEDGGYTQTNGLYDYREDWIHLKYRPGISVTKIEVDVSAYGDAASWQELSTATGYIIALDRSLLMIVGDVKPSAMFQTVRVTYTVGYAVTPQMIGLIAMELAGNIMHEMLQRRLSPVIRVDYYTIRMIIPEAFTRDMQQRLGPYAHLQVLVG